MLRPHPPFVAPEPYNAMYDPAAVPEIHAPGHAEDEGRQHPWLACQLSRKAYRATDNEKRLRRLKAVYYGLMSRVDAEIGRLMAFLKEIGAMGSTLDHLHLGSRRADRRPLADRQVRLFRRLLPHPADHPGSAPAGRQRARRVIASFTENVDIMPTMLEAIGAEIPVQCDGASPRAVPRRRRPPPTNGARRRTGSSTSAIPPTTQRERALGLTMHQCAMNIIRGERYKYVHFTNLPPLFFDLKARPGRDS